MWNPKKPNLQPQKVEWWQPEGWQKQGDFGHRVHISTYKMNMFWISNVCSDYSEQDCVIYVKVAKKVDLKYFHSVQNGNYVW